VYTVKERGGKPDRKPPPLPYGIRNPNRNLRTLKIMPRNRKEFGFRGRDITKYSETETPLFLD
jgi:hypothetical protein